MAEFTMETTCLTRNMDSESTFMQMEELISDSGHMDLKIVRECTFCQMVMLGKEFGKVIRSIRRRRICLKRRLIHKRDFIR